MAVENAEQVVRGELRLEEVGLRATEPPRCDAKARESARARGAASPTCAAKNHGRSSALIVKRSITFTSCPSAARAQMYSSMHERLCPSTLGDDPIAAVTASSMKAPWREREGARVSRAAAARARSRRAPKPSIITKSAGVLWYSFSSCAMYLGSAILVNARARERRARELSHPHELERETVIQVELAEEGDGF